MKNKPKTEQVVILKANFALRMRIGKGAIAPKVLLACRRVMEENAFDFTPMARDILKTILSEIEMLQANKRTHEETLGALRIQVMQFKANAATFRYPLLSEIAHKLLDFLDEINELDASAVEIVMAFHNTAEKLLVRRDENHTDSRARKIPEEFEKAFERYWKRKTAPAS